MTHQDEPGVSPAEQQRRREVLEEIRHSTQMEGGHSDDDGRALQDAWARGEISADKLVERTRRLLGLDD